MPRQKNQLGKPLRSGRWACPRCFIQIMNPSHFSVDPEIEAALAANRAIVALESTVIAHGLPRPQNLETGQRVEQIVREQGATPATIAVIDGKLCVGLNQQQIGQVANRDDIRKLSTRDLAWHVAQGLGAVATTVATARIAQHCRRVFRSLQRAASVACIVVRFRMSSRRQPGSTSFQRAIFVCTAWRLAAAHPMGSASAHPVTGDSGRRTSARDPARSRRSGGARSGSTF